MRNIQKIIANIVAKEPNPDPKYTPHLVLSWYTKTEGQIYHDLSTGERLSHNDEDNWSIQEICDKPVYDLLVEINYRQ